MNRLLSCLLCLAFAGITNAANPTQVSLGLQLFTQEFASSSPGLNGDGLGPVFNEASCVACHNVGGVGGSGQVRNNARSVGMQELIYNEFEPALAAAEQRHWQGLQRAGRAGNVIAPSIRRMNDAVAKFSPAFITPTGTIGSSFPIHRRGGSPALVALRDQSLTPFNPHWNDDNYASCDTVHQERVPREITNNNQSVSMKVHVFARNTTPLFGTGLIDQVPDSVLWQVAKSQRSDSEISGRPGTLSDGTLGKFGWRANFATLRDFNENACSAELGLQSRRVTQPIDLANRNYVNPNPDISDDAIQAMTAFVAALPRPIRDIPTDSRERQRVALGEQRFAAIGCSKCHVPSLAGIQDLYSDLLLHDMGPYAIDMAGAPPYLRNVAITEQLTGISTTESTSTMQTRTYYGHSSSMVSASSRTTGFQVGTPTSSQTGTVSANRYATKLISPILPPRTVVTPISNRASSTNNTESEQLAGSEFVNEFTGNSGQIETKTSNQSNTIVETQLFLTAEYEQTLVNQEWKTPPLWGVRDSAPYMHDGRAETILEAIAMHDGEGRGARNRFFALGYEDQQAIIAFLDTFAAPSQGVIEAPKKFTRRDFVSR